MYWILILKLIYCILILKLILILIYFSFLGQIDICKAAIEPVWHLPTVATRFGCTEHKLRTMLFTNTNGMYPELLTRNDIKVFLPPIGGLTIYIFGNPETISDPNVELTVRVHDECNGSDVFGSDILK